MIGTTSRIQELWQKALSLSSLEPGQGYDDIGYALCNIVTQPRLLAESVAVLEQLEKDAPGILESLHHISFQSELLHEKSYADKIISTDVTAPIENILATYGYGFTYQKIARLEAGFLPLNGARICYIGPSTIPFSALAIHQETRGEVIWFDSAPERVHIGASICRKLEEAGIIEQNAITICLYRNINDITEALTTWGAPDLCSSFFDDTDMDTAMLAECLLQAGCKRFLRATTHGMAQILYPPMPELLHPGLRFVKGYIPPHVTDDLSDKGWEKSENLSFMSLALFEPSI